MFTEMFPILSTRDLPGLLAFYCDGLDAQVVYQFPAIGPPDFVSVDLAGGHLGIGFDPEAGGAQVSQRTALWYYADSCDDAVDRLRALGATVLTGPADMPWGERVAQLLDPDGNPFQIAQRLTLDQPRG